MTITLINEMTQSDEPFIPNDPTRVTMYVCGPTVYDTPHIGNARSAVIFDVLYRLLRHEYGEDAVHYARNYTDIDDKIMARARQNGETIQQLTTRTIAEYKHLMDQLSVLTPTYEPKATENIAAIQAMIKILISKGHAYVANGHVFYDINSFGDHGKLSGHAIHDLQVSEDTKSMMLKKNPHDFVLWKPSTNDQPGWISTFTQGFGRPGWHIECSAMIDSVLGKTIDIHGGGADLRFPHHECEISQSCAANGTDELSRYWIHNALLTVDGLKMSKSAGNFVTVDQAIASASGPVVRLALLSGHYRQNLNWTSNLVRHAALTLRGWHRVLDGVVGDPVRNEYADSLLVPLYDKMNTVNVIANINMMLPLVDTPGVASGIRYAASVLGFNLVDNDDWLRGVPDRAEVEALIQARLDARQQRDWVESDRIRAELSERGIVLEDAPDGTVWLKAVGDESDGRM